MIEFAEIATDPAGITLGGQLARAYFLAGSADSRAIEVADRVLEAAEHADLVAIIADTLVTRGTALTNVGRPIEGLGAIVAGRELAEVSGLGATVLRAYNNEGVTNWSRDPRAALESTRAGLNLARRLGARSWVSGLVTGIGDNSLRTGEWPTALAELTAALAEKWERPDHLQLLNSAITFWALRGEPVDDGLTEVQALLVDSGDPQMRAGTEMAAAHAAFASGDLLAARAGWKRAASLVGSVLPVALPLAARSALWGGEGAAARDDLAELDGSGFHGAAIEADRTTVRAGIAALEGRDTDALPLYRDALRAWRDLGLAWDEALCGLDMALLLDPANPEVHAAAETSREIFERLEAAPFIARLDEAFGRSADAATAPSS
jgi:hypothetical protein